MNRIMAILAVLVAAGAAFFLLSSGGKAEPDAPGGPPLPAEVQKAELAAIAKVGASGQSETVSAPESLKSTWTGSRVFRFALEVNPPTLDPVKITDVTSHGVASKIFNTLVRYDTKMELVPDLAEALPAWNAADNSYTFKLRKGVTFHDGSPMTAQDVKYSWERLLDPAESKRMQILAAVKGANAKIDGKGEVKEAEGLQVVDDYTFKVVLTGPSPTFLHEIIMVNAAVVPKGSAEKAQAAGQTFSQVPVGTGPFKLVEWQPNQRLVMARHDDYFRGKPFLDKLTFEIVNKPQMRLEKFLAGEFEVCDIPFGQFKTMQRKHADLLKSNPTFRTNYLGISIHSVKEGGESVPADPLGTNVKLRQAINCAIDRDNICDTILEGRSKPANSILPPAMMAHDPNLRGWTYDPKKAKALLAEAGYPDGKGLRKLEFFYRQDPDAQKIAVAIQADLQSIGLDVDICALDWAALLDRLDKNPPDLFYLGWVADYNDPDNFLFWLFHTKQWGDPGNHTRYSNPQVDALLDKAHVSMDQNERVKLYHEAECKILEEATWCVLETRVNYILVHPHVKNAQEQLTNMDVGWLMGSVDFGTVEFK